MRGAEEGEDEKALERWYGEGGKEELAKNGRSVLAAYEERYQTLVCGGGGKALSGMGREGGGGGGMESLL